MRYNWIETINQTFSNKLIKLKSFALDNLGVFEDIKPNRKKNIKQNIQT